jgi:hypothetical protein
MSTVPLPQAQRQRSINGRLFTTSQSVLVSPHSSASKHSFLVEILRLCEICLHQSSRPIFQPTSNLRDSIYMTVLRYIMSLNLPSIRQSWTVNPSRSVHALMPFTWARLINSTIIFNLEIKYTRLQLVTLTSNWGEMGTTRFKSSSKGFINILNLSWTLLLVHIDFFWTRNHVHFINSNSSLPHIIIVYIARLYQVCTVINFHIAMLSWVSFVVSLSKLGFHRVSFIAYQ